MPVNALVGFNVGRSPGPCWVRPDRRTWFAALDLRTARDFLALPGVVVSGHVGRNVSRVELDGVTAYLKREHRVRCRDRFRSWCDGFGWVSLSAREATVLSHLEACHLPGPRCLACGEADGQGFLLVEAAAAASDLRSLGRVNDELAARIGSTVARLHAAGVDQPDLFAKHILARQNDLSFTILDWQRAVLRPSVDWPNRVRSLAALWATAPEGLFPESTWGRLLTEYFATVNADGPASPNLDRFADQVRRVADRLLVRKGIWAQHGVRPSVAQELVRIDGETVCAIPEVAAEVGHALPVATLYDPARDGQMLRLPNGRTGVLRVRRYRLPFGRWWTGLRGRSWRSPELQAARLLFHLERHGISAPALLAYGQTVPAAAPARSFVLSEPIVGDPTSVVDRTAILVLLDQLHAAGCSLRGLGPAGEPFGIVNGRVVIRDVSRLRLGRTRAGRDRALVEAFFRGQR